MALPASSVVSTDRPEPALPGKVGPDLSSGDSSESPSLVRKYSNSSKSASSSVNTPSVKTLSFAAAVSKPSASRPAFIAPTVNRPNTLIFRLPIYDNRRWTRKEIIAELFECIPESAVHAIQIVPGNWVRLTFIKSEDKFRFLSAGIAFDGKHVTFQEAQPSISFVRLSHLPVEVTSDAISSTLSQFGKVLNVSQVHDPDFRGLLTGDRIVKMILHGSHLPPRIFVSRYAAAVWYRGMPTICRICFRQGHVASACPFKGKCFRCGGENHSARSCNVQTATPPRPSVLRPDRNAVSVPVSSAVNVPSSSDAQPVVESEGSGVVNGDHTAPSVSVVSTNPVGTAVSESVSETLSVVVQTPSVSVASEPVSDNVDMVAVNDTSTVSEPVADNVDMVPVNDSSVVVSGLDNSVAAVDGDGASPVISSDLIVLAEVAASSSISVPEDDDDITDHPSAAHRWFGDSTSDSSDMSEDETNAPEKIYESDSDHDPHPKRIQVDNTASDSEL